MCVADQTVFVLLFSGNSFLTFYSILSVKLLHFAVGCRSMSGLPSSMAHPPEQAPCPLPPGEALVVGHRFLVDESESIGHTP